MVSLYISINPELFPPINSPIIMFYRVVFVAVCFLFSTISSSEQMHETNNEVQSEDIIDPNKHESRILELKKRKEIAKNYLSTLAKAKETWVDPYEMISFPVKEEIVNSADDNTAERVIKLGSDEEPLFSDIKGDVFGTKMVKLENSRKDSNSESDGFFSKDRQQICVLDSIYVSRWLKMLILKAEEESNLEPVFVSFLLDANLLDKIKELSTAKSLEIAQLDELVSNMITEASVTRQKTFEWSLLLHYSKDLLRVLGLISAALFFTYAIYQCISHHPRLTVIGFIICLSIFWHWMHLYQQRQAYKHAELSSMKVPFECQKYDFGLIEHFYEYIKSYLANNNECVKYYEALMVDPFWEVSFTMAASEAATAMLFQPLSAVSRNINIFLKQLFDGLSLTMITALAIVTILLLIMLCNYRIKLPFFMGAIEPAAPNAGSCIEDVRPTKKAPICTSGLFSSSKEVSKKLLDQKNNAHSECLQACGDHEPRQDCEEISAATTNSQELYCTCLDNKDTQYQNEVCSVCKNQPCDEMYEEGFEKICDNLESVK